MRSLLVPSPWAPILRPRREREGEAPLFRILANVLSPPSEPRQPPPPLSLVPPRPPCSANALRLSAVVSVLWRRRQGPWDAGSRRGARARGRGTRALERSAAGSQDDELKAIEKRRARLTCPAVCQRHCVLLRPPRPGPTPLFVLARYLEAKNDAPATLWQF